MTASPADAVARVLEVLDRLEIPYLAGESVASSVHGISRPTLDLDIVADLRADQVDELVALLQPDFYADPGMIREALERKRSFNVIHYQTSFKVDVFPLRDDDYSRLSFARRRFEQCLSFGPEPLECAVATAEKHDSSQAGMVSGWGRNVGAPVERFARRPESQRPTPGSRLLAAVGSVSKGG